MYLRAIELQGFKSFPDKTRLEFNNDITAIVGPNGSGKSNISDALLWVMGEQSSKTLRGAKMEDVIFGGTEKRSPMGFAEVTLVLDNTLRLLEMDRDEVAITRRYYRTGESEYYINKESVRLKDINSLLMDTGLGRDGYSVIGQGRIAEIVSSKSTDRRQVFEEAAGISRYRYRKEEAERKIERTEENLLRINDKIDELEIQVGPLKEQAEVAKKYLVLRDELRVREISLWLVSLDKIRANADGIKEEYMKAELELEEAQSALESVYASQRSISDRMQRRDDEDEQIRERLSEAEAAVSKAESDITVVQADIANKQANITNITESIDEQEKRLGDIEANISEAKKRIEAIDGSLAELSAEETSKTNMLEGCRIKCQSREEKFEGMQTDFMNMEIEARNADSRISLLSDMEKDYEGFSKAVKNVMREAKRGNLQGVHGPLSTLLRTDDEYALAIETALGNNSQNIVVDTAQDAVRGIEFLKRADSGRATFDPIDSIDDTPLNVDKISDLSFIGLASDLVRYDEKYAGIIRHRLGRTLVVETLNDAVRIAAKNGGMRMVSLDGQMLNADGSMTGGSAVKNSGTLSRINELERLKKDRISLESRKNNLSTELDRARKAISAARYELETLQEERAGIQVSISACTSEKNAVQENISQFEALKDILSGDNDNRRRLIAEAQSEIDTLKSAVAVKNAALEDARANAENIRAELARIRGKRTELEQKRDKANEAVLTANAQVNDAERKRARIEQKKLASEYEEKQITDKLWDNYELGYSEACRVRQPVENVQRANRELNELRRSIAALGTPNIGAIEEFERVNDRYSYLTGQRADIDKARKELLGIISDVTKEMESVFAEQFNRIDKAFREIFTELFEGGKASISLEDPDNILDCGIDIKVQPPGKTVSSISLLSGGEMAFVAIALYFAILKVRPTPFCVMDEIEAALDEVNVSKFAKYLRRYSDKTQFLVISHRRGTMEEADVLYGVTMQEKGVSGVISLDLNEAEKMIK